MSYRNLRSAGLGLSLALALFSVATADAAEDERRALSLDDVSEEQVQNTALRAEAEAKRREAMDRLRALLRDADDGDRKAEMMLRLADLYYQQGRADYFEEMETFQAAFDACFNRSETGDECDKMKPDNKTSFDWYGKAVKLYELILKHYPRFARADEATFFLGSTYQEMDKKERALGAFKQLVKLYPTSRYVADGYVLIGEYYFEKNEAFPALRAYLKATNFKESDRYAYAMYKLAWCYYNVEDYGKSIDTMKAVVAFSMENSEGDSSKIRLEEEALKDLVRFFADAGEMDEAYDYFTKLGKKDLIRSMLKRLAGLYFEQGKWDQSVDTYRRLIMETPSHPDNPGYQNEIVDAYRKMGQKDKVLDEIRRLKTEYGKASAWWRANASNPEAQADADDAIEKSLRRTATEFNKEARQLDKTRHPRAGAAYEAAIQAYQVYLEDYSQNKNAYNVHYDFAELLYDRKMYEGAFNEYMTVVKMDPKGQHSRFCAESAIFAAEEMVKKAGGGEIKAAAVKVTKDVEPQPLSDWEKRLIEACRQYAELYPSDKKVEIATYKSAFLLYQRYHFTEAAEQFRAVINMSPKSRNAEFSANLILDALAVREEYLSLRDTAKAFYDQKDLGSSKFKKEMYELYASSSFKVIELEFEKNGDKGKTADSFVAFYEEFPTYKNSDLALNNAAAYYYQVNRVADSMRIRHILIDDEKFGPKTKFYYSQVAALGFDYERLADFDIAANYYDQLWSLYPEEREKKVKAKADDETLAKMDEQAAAALYSAAVFRNALGDWQGGVDRYNTFLTAFPKDERGLDTRLTIANIYETEEQWELAAKAFNQFYSKGPKDLSTDMNFFARLHYGRALLAQGKVSEARKHYASTIKLFKKLTDGGLAPGVHTQFAAEMMYEVSKPEFTAYQALVLKGAGRGASQKREDKAFKDSLQAKTKARVELEATYTEIIQTGAGEWALASLVSLGRAYENMTKTLIESPTPSYLTEDQEEIYRMTLEDKGYVFTEKAVEAYKLALEKSYELNLYNDNTAYATRRLGSLRPEDYPGLVETIPEPGLTAEKVRAYDLETER